MAKQILKAKEEHEEIKKEFSNVPPRIYQIAKAFGLIHEGWTLQEYLLDAVKNQGYETVYIWGQQGSGKSSRMLQMGYWVYQDWDLVLKNIVFKPSEFVKRLRKVPKGKRIPCLLWDDIGVHYTSSTFKTDIKQYEAVDAAWAAIRTKCNVIVITSPLIDRLAKNVKDNITFEVFIGKNQMEMIRRIIRLPGIEKMESNLFKYIIERVRPFNLYDVPKDVFQQYWDMRLQLTEEALERLDKTIGEESLEDLIRVTDAANELGMSVMSLLDAITRGACKKRMINGVAYITKEDFERIKKNRRVKKSKVRYTF